MNGLNNLTHKIKYLKEVIMKNILENENYLEDLQLVANKFDFNDLKNKSILIPGGMGLIGSAVVDLIYALNTFKDFNTQIYIASRDLDEFSERYQGVKNITFVEYDALKSVEFDFPVDYIVYCVGIASPQLYVEKPVETIKTSVWGIDAIVKYAIEKKVKRVLYVSSSEVYGVKSDLDSFVEDKYGVISLDNVRLSYAVGKVASELLCRSYYCEYGLDYVVVRPGHIFGPTATKNDKKISSEFAYLSAYGKQLILKSAGLQKRSYCYSLDCAVAILIALLHGSCGEAYNIGHDEVTSIREMAQYMAEAGSVELIVGEPSEKELMAFNPMNNSCLNINKIKNIGFRNSFSVRDACDHTVKIIKNINLLNQ